MTERLTGSLHCDVMRVATLGLAISIILSPCVAAIGK